MNYFLCVSSCIEKFVKHIRRGTEKCVCFFFVYKIGQIK